MHPTGLSPVDPPPHEVDGINKRLCKGRADTRINARDGLATAVGRDDMPENVDLAS